jgi:hypothetical protein
MKGTRTHLKHRLMLAIGLALLLMLLAACGASATGSAATGSATGTPASATSTPTTPARTQKCGAVHTLRLQVVPTDKSHAQNTENCFWQAYQQCHPAMLIYSQGNVDTVTLHTFSLKNQNGQCVITDSVQRSVLPHSPSPLGDYTCSSLAQQNDGLHFASCGKEGNVLVPSVGTE